MFMSFSGFFLLLKMHLSFILLCLTLEALEKCAAESDWCYSGCEHTPGHWADSYISCGGQKQSPININTLHVKKDENLKKFSFHNFDSHVLDTIENNNHTVKVKLDEGVEVSGGGLNGIYSTIQFHFHWGSTKDHPGSEHTINGHRYPMEMHIVSLKKGLTVDQAKETPEGIAVLGFFINATDGDASGPWSNLTSYLTKTTGTPAKINHTISINDLIGNVNLEKFFRYHGSLTTPACNEAVVWTVFQEPINVDKMLVQRFPEKTGLTNVYRPIQALHGRTVNASPAASPPSEHPWCYDGDHCDYKPSKWHNLPDSHCGANQQSPINIVSKEAVKSELLGAFTFKNFDNKHALKYIINSGHSVKCVMKEDKLEVSGGGLGHVYSTLQFHFHWGDATSKSKGSEHTTDSKRYPMEMHIVNKRKDLTLDDALKTSNGLAVLGFFIEASDTSKSSSGGSGHQETSSTSDMEPWKKLTKYLSGIERIGTNMTVTDEISIDDLLGSVSRTSYYRYNGSLTTPGCYEAVVWTVFKNSVKVDKSLMEMFPKKIGYSNVYRPVQRLHGRKIYSSATSSVPAPVVPVLLLACLNNLHL